jgi:hypothetical protein
MASPHEAEIRRYLASQSPDAHLQAQQEYDRARQARQVYQEQQARRNHELRLAELREHSAASNRDIALSRQRHQEAMALERQRQQARELAARHVIVVSDDDDDNAPPPLVPVSLSPPAVPQRPEQQRRLRQAASVPLRQSANYEVEAIWDEEMRDDGHVWYRIKWKNYPPSEASWVRDDACTSCDVMLNQFRSRQRQQQRGK